MAYTDIAITAPSSAEEGEPVSVSVKVTSTLAKYAPFKTTIDAVPDLYPDYVIGGGTDVIKSGESKTYSASFTMPDCKTTAFVWVERWDGYHWTYYGSDSKVVSLKTKAALPTAVIVLGIGALSVLGIALVARRKK